MDIAIREIVLDAGGAELEGVLTLPDAYRGVRARRRKRRYGPRNRQVARPLNGGGLATLLFDLLTPSESAEDERTAAH